MMRQRLTPPEWLITVGAGVFIFALTVSAVFVPAIRWLHVAQASIYVAAVLLSSRRSPWGHFVGASAAGLWDVLAMFASRLFVELIDHPTRPDLLLQGLAWLANLAVVVGSIWAFSRLTTKSRRDIGRLAIAFVGVTAFLIGATAILAPDYLVAFTQARHPHWPWTRS